MFKFLGSKLFGAKKQDTNKPKHRLTISIPSTKYDPPKNIPSKHSKNIPSTTSSLTSTQSLSDHNNNNNTHHRSKSSKVSTKYPKPKPIKPPKPPKHNKSKSNIPSHTIQPVNTNTKLTKNGKKAASSSALNSPFKLPPNDPSRPIFQRSDIFHANSSLKFEITIQYQQQMWTVYKTLCDFIELHNKLKVKYGVNAPSTTTTIEESTTTTSNNSTDDDKSRDMKDSSPSSAISNIYQKPIEVPPLLPLGLFYLYFQDENKSNTTDSSSSHRHNKDNGGKYSPKHVYKQIYQYHQQQIMLQKRQEAQLMQQMKQIQHIRQIQHEQQLLLQQRQMQQLQQDAITNTPPNQQNAASSTPTLGADSSPFGVGTSSSLPLQGQIGDKQQERMPKMQPLTMNRSVPTTPTGDRNDSHLQFPPPNHPKLNRSVFDAESPFLKHMRVSLQIWLRVIVDDPILMISPELSSFIQFRWIYKKDKAKSEGYKKSSIKSTDPRYSKSNIIIGGVHAPDNNQYFDKMGKNKDGSRVKNGKLRNKLGLNGIGGVNFNIMNSLQDNDGSDNDTKRPTLSDFTLLKVVGKGAFGKVLQVRKVDDSNIYAMKILKKENVIKRNQIEHTKTERRVLGYVKHPFIVSLYYAFQTETKLFLVLDYCGGGELFFHLGKAGRFKEDRARFYAASIALALEYLHSKNIIYRDLKPENVLLDNEGHIKLTDFGLSKENITDIQLAHSFCGTPEYLAPEILRRCGHGKPADWWSLGALLYEMLTGMPPFYSRDRDRLFEKILHSKLRFPNYFSDAAVNILTLLMQRNWKKRLGSYQSSNPSKYNNDPKKKSFAQLKGAQQIKRHIFFKSIDWKLLYERKLKPPFIPKLNDDQTNNFDAEFTEMPIYSMDNNERSRYIHREKRKYLLKFESFSYVRNENLLNQHDESQESDDDDDDEEESTSNTSTDTDSDDDDDEEDEDEEDDNEAVGAEIKVIDNNNNNNNDKVNVNVNVNNPNDAESPDSEQSDSGNQDDNKQNKDNNDNNNIQNNNNNNNTNDNDDGFDVYD